MTALDCLSGDRGSTVTVESHNVVHDRCLDGRPFGVEHHGFRDTGGPIDRIIEGEYGPYPREEADGIQVQGM